MAYYWSRAFLRPGTFFIDGIFQMDCRSLRNGCLLREHYRMISACFMLDGDGILSVDDMLMDDGSQVWDSTIARY